MSNRHNPKYDTPVFDPSDAEEFEFEGLTYDVSLDDMLDQFDDEDEDETWTGWSRSQTSARLNRMRRATAPDDADPYSDDWEDGEGW